MRFLLKYYSKIAYFCKVYAKPPYNQERHKSLIVNIWLFLLITVIWFDVKKFVPGESSFYLGLYSDFTTRFIHLSSILVWFGVLLAFIVKSDFRRIKAYSSFYTILVTALLASLIIMTKSVGHEQLGLYYTFSALTAIVLHGTLISISKYINIYKTLLYLIFLTTLESILSLIQFALQHDLGLRKIGESYTDANVAGVARIFDGFGLWLRSYGTFPHPNVLSIFLSISVLICLVMYIYSNSLRPKVFWLIVSGGTFAALMLSFSRAGILSAMVGLSSAGIYFLYRRFNTKKVLFYGFFALLLCGSLVFVLRDLYVIRADVNDPAISERILYNNTGLVMIKNKPVFGLGPGESIVQIEKYSERSLKPWEKNPIHNYFLIASAEIGLIYGVALVLFILIPFFRLKKLGLKKIPLDTDGGLVILLIAINFAFITVMFFDHYLYTLEQPRLFFWLLLALTFIQIEKVSHANASHET